MEETLFGAFGAKTFRDLLRGATTLGAPLRTTHIQQRKTKPC